MNLKTRSQGPHSCWEYVRQVSLLWATLARRRLMQIKTLTYVPVNSGWYQFFGRGKSGDDRAPHARDLSARFKIQKKQNKYGGTKIITNQVFFPVCPRLDQNKSCPLGVSC